MITKNLCLEINNKNKKGSATSARYYNHEQTELIMTLLFIELNLGGYVSAKSLCQPNCWKKSVQPKEVQKHTCSLTQCKYKLKKPNVYATILRTGDGKFSEVQALSKSYSNSCQSQGPQLSSHMNLFCCKCEYLL